MAHWKSLWNFASAVSVEWQARYADCIGSCKLLHWTKLINAYRREGEKNRADHTVYWPVINHLSEAEHSHFWQGYIFCFLSIYRFLLHFFSQFLLLCPLFKLKQVEQVGRWRAKATKGDASFLTFRLEYGFRYITVQMKSFIPKGPKSTFHRCCTL